MTGCFNPNFSGNPNIWANLDVEVIRNADGMITGLKKVYKGKTWRMTITRTDCVITNVSGWIADCDNL